MSQIDKLKIEIKEIMDDKNIKVNEPMSKHTSFKVGGLADLLLLPQDSNQVIQIIKLCNNLDVPYYIIGNGSNLLVRDGGIRGVVIKLTNLNTISIEDSVITAQGGASFIKVWLWDTGKYRWSPYYECRCI